LVALKDLAKMVMLDLDLYRDKDLSDAKERMANSITQFTRGFTTRATKVADLSLYQSSSFDRPSAAVSLNDGSGSGGWRKRFPSADKSLAKAPEGVMDFYGLTLNQQAIDSTHSPKASEAEDSRFSDIKVDESLEEEESDSDVERDDLELHVMYRYACQLMRETLDVEGVCFVDIEGIERSVSDTNNDPKFVNFDGFGIYSSSQRHREVGQTGTILGYSHSARFGRMQKTSWPPIALWDEESSAQVWERKSSEVATPDASSIDDFTAEEEVLPSMEAGRLGYTFLRRFLSEKRFGEIFNDDIPDALLNFLPSSVASAILVPVYDFDLRPFAVICAYTTDKHKNFLEEEKLYLEVCSKITNSC
jgi:hypothetical protein